MVVVNFIPDGKFTPFATASVAKLGGDGGDLEALEFVRAKLGTWSETDLWPEALISGDDLITLGLEPGPSFREILTLIEDEQLEQRLVDRDGAIRFVRQRFGVE